MKNFKLEIKSFHNAAMADSPAAEVHKILEQVKNRIMRNGIAECDGMILRDTNGNRVGTVEIEGEVNDTAPIYVAGWNKSGYMPETDPAHFLTFDDARDYIFAEIDSIFCTMDDDKAESYEKALDYVEKQTEEFSVMVDNTAYWVTEE